MRSVSVRAVRVLVCMFTDELCSLAGCCLAACQGLNANRDLSQQARVLTHHKIVE